jgi:asparagine synthase (glutamine-hydrolysing)
MSAIAGIIRLDRQPVDRAALERMQTVLAPYGPDAQQQWRQEGVGLLRTLLRTTPEDSLDRQPLQSAEANCVLVFDGRLDNRAELAEELGLSAADCAALADSELAWLACQRWDSQAVEHLYGAYALACWQPVRQRLWLARDPLGQRPLFWHQQDGFFAFASLPKALFCIPGVPRELCEARMLDRLALLPLKGPESAFREIYRVEPGHLVTLEKGRVSSQRYHRFDARRELQLPGDGDYLAAFEQHLQRAIANCLRSSGPIVTQLSSGFDSSTVTALAAQQLDQHGQRLHAFTAVPREGFDGPVPKGRHGDESGGAQAVASRFANIDHELLRTTDTNVLDGINTLAEAADAMTHAPCNEVWVSAIHRRAQALGCKVLMTGQLGNMSISYTGETYLAALFRRGRWLSWWRELRALQVTQRRSKWALLGKSVAPSLPSPLWRWLAWRLNRHQPLTSYSPIHPDWMSRKALTDRVQASGWDLGYQPWHNGRRMRIAVIERRDPGEYFMAADLHGFALRDPTCDLRLVEFCLAVPDHQYLRNGQTRWLLRRMMADTLPAEILFSTGKGYQAADWYEGINQQLPMLRENLQQLARHPRVAQMLDVQELQRLLDDWPESGWETSSVIHRYRLKLMRGIAAAHFIRYVEGNNR